MKNLLSPLSTLSVVHSAAGAPNASGTTHQESAGIGVVPVGGRLFAPPPNRYALLTSASFIGMSPESTVGQGAARRYAPLPAA